MTRKILLTAAFLLVSANIGLAQETRTIVDAAGRSVEIPAVVERVICSGPGCLRLLTYLQAEDMAVAADDIESKHTQFDARPYALANPQFKDLPLFGEFRGQDNPELIVTLEPQPQVIFKTYATMGYDPQELQDKAGIPVVVLDYGDLGAHREQLFQAMRLMGGVVGRGDRAEDVVAFFEGHICDLEARTADIPQESRPDAFIGGVAHRGPHGFQSTEPSYPPFDFVAVTNPAAEGVGGGTESADVAKEKIVEWDPEYLFLDLSTLQMGDEAGGLFELRTDPAYRSLTAVQEGRVYGMLPYNWYSANYGSILADAYAIGKIVYPERFQDVDPAAEADEIYAFLVGEPVFARMNELFGGLAYVPIPLD